MKLTTKQKYYKASLIKRQHTICSGLGISDEERKAMLESNYGVSSSKDLHIDELKQFCDSLEGKQVDELDQARKRVIKIIFVYTNFLGYSYTMDEVKNFARKSAKAKYFNSIPLKKLKQMYRIFGDLHKKKSTEWSDALLDSIAEQVNQGT